MSILARSEMSHVGEEIRHLRVVVFVPVLEPSDKGQQFLVIEVRAELQPVEHHHKCIFVDPAGVRRVQSSELFSNVDTIRNCLRSSSNREEVVKYK